MSRVVCEVVGCGKKRRCKKCSKGGEARCCTGDNHARKNDETCHSATCPEYRVSPVSSPAPCRDRTPSPVRKEFRELAQTQRHKRKRYLLDILNTHKTKPTDLVARRHSPAAVFSLGKSLRCRVRAGLKNTLPSERAVAKFKEHVRELHHTRTISFSNRYGKVGACVVKITELVESLTFSSSFIVISGDSGSDVTKIGISYEQADKNIAFTPLVVYKGQDGMHDMFSAAHFSHPIRALTEITNSTSSSSSSSSESSSSSSSSCSSSPSSAVSSIFVVLQRLLDSSTTTRPVFLGGDWKWINSVLGLQAASSTYPCPICIVDHNSFHLRPRNRNYGHDRFSMASSRPLLSCSPERIVPLPLHLFLGICNQIIKVVFPVLLSQSIVNASISEIKTVHAPGNTGRSDLYDLNGKEISSWINRHLAFINISDSSTATTTATTTTASSSSSSMSLSSSSSSSSSSSLSVSFEAAVQSSSSSSKLIVMCRWMKILSQLLLHKQTWSEEEVALLDRTVKDIIGRWVSITNLTLKPKTHMLLHAVEFAKQYKMLGRVSEAQQESCHAFFRILYHNHHRNQTKNEPERLRRCLSDVLRKSVQPIINNTQ